MVDYSKLSDFEINSAVHNALLNKPYSLVFMGNDQIVWTAENGDQIVTNKVPYTKNGVHDYLNNPADAWPIIDENNITIINDHPEIRYAVNNLNAYRNGSNNCIVKSDSNGLRAAMIVFLMMQDAKNG